MIDIDYYSVLGPGVQRTVRWLESLDYFVVPGVSEVITEDINGKPVVTSSMLCIFSTPENMIEEAEVIAGSLKLMLGNGVLEAHQEENCGVFLSAVFDPVGWSASIDIYGLDDSMLPPGVGEK